MSPPARSVLIGFGDALAAPEVASSLLAAGYHVASFVRRGQPVALRRLNGVEVIEVTAPEQDLETCLRELGVLAARYDVTMPLNDPALLVCDRGLGSEVVIAGPRGAQAQLAMDKRLQLRAAGEAGLGVPEWLELAPGTPVSLDGGWGWPVALKPALAVEESDGRLRRLSPRIVSNANEVDAAWKNWGEATPVIVQRWISGVGAGLFGMADAAGLHHLSAHRRVRMMNPAGSGSSACARLGRPKS